jgi:leader peptidase (prepilin peptidase) / N-methyltransferase
LISQVALLAAALIVGSFVGVLVKRLPAGRPVAVSRSACGYCQHLLSWGDLIPVVSWLATRGRCRHCGQSIGLFYPAVELAALGIAVWTLLVLPGWITWVGAGLGWALLTLAWIDWEQFLLPDAITLPLAAAGLGIAWLISPAALLDHALGAALGFSVLLAVAWLYRALRGRDGLGAGDAKLLCALGAWVAWQGLPTVVLYAAVSGLLLTFLPALLGRRIELSRRLPFGPHLCLGGWLVWLYGPLIPL